jgi:hypothetical protein
MNEGDNQGYYPIVSNTGNEITIDSTGPYGSLSSQDGLYARIYRFERGSGTGAYNKGNDIQIDLQSGRYYAHLYLHAWPSYWNNNKLHTFKITPYYLTKSQLDSSGIIPVWSFTCKSVVQEIDLLGATFKEYWGNFTT